MKIQWLKDFLVQAQTTNLKSAHFPKEYGPYKMKVSFGMGVSAHVPWVSFYPAGMSTSNGYYPVYLYYKSQNKLILAFGISETNEYKETWREEILKGSPKISQVIENPTRYGDSWEFKSYEVDSNDEKIKITKNGTPVLDDELEQDLSEILQLFSKNLDVELIDSDSPVSAGLFYMEKQLEDFVIENWSTLELSRNLELIYKDGELVSQQFRTGIGPIDILAKDKTTGSYVVIELKRNQTSDDTIGQVSRYMGWVSENLDDPDVRGIIISGKYDEKLHYAQKLINSVDVYIYEVIFNLKEHKR
jgi:hypothetical protein